MEKALSLGTKAIRHGWYRFIQPSEALGTHAMPRNLGKLNKNSEGCNATERMEYSLSRLGGV